MSPPQTNKRKLSIAEMDDDFFHYSAHINSNLMTKIEKGECVDLAKLLPKDKILHNEGCLQMIQKEDSAFIQLVLLSEKDTPTISSLRHWEQAFEIYATLYSCSSWQIFRVV